MGVEIITKADLEIFGANLIQEFSKILEKQHKQKLADWLKSSEVTEILKMSPAKLQKLRIGGKVEGVKIEGTWYYSLRSINLLFKKEGDK